VAFWRRQQRIENLVLKHLESVDGTLRLFQDALRAYLGEQDVKRASELAFLTHEAEGKADDIRREVESELLTGALLPHSRRDVLGIIEEVDRLANSGESVLDYLLFQRIDIPEELRSDLLEIIERTGAVFEEVKAALRALFHDMRRVSEHTKAIEAEEGKIDRLERRVIKRLFKTEMDLARKLQIHGFVERLVELSDRAEDLSDRLDIVVIERRF